MPFNFTFIANAAPKATGTGIDLADIPQDVKDGVEEVYAALKTNPGRMSIDFPTVADKLTFVKQVVAYCAQRPEGAIRYRQSPVKKDSIKETELHFQITDLKTPNEKVTDDIREAADAVKKTAKK